MASDAKEVRVPITKAMVHHLLEGHLEGVQETHPETRIEGTRLIGSRNAMASLYGAVMEHARAQWENGYMGERKANTVIALRDRLESAIGDVIPEDERMGWTGVVSHPALRVAKRNPKKKANPNALRRIMRL